MKDPGKDKLSDEQIVDLVISGGTETKYFEIIYTRYHIKVNNKCMSIVKDKAMAAEITEDVFSKVYEKLSSFKGKALFTTWLYSITYNCCIDSLRLKKKIHYPNWNKEQEMVEIPDNLEEVKEDIDYDQLVLVMEELHPEERVLIQMKYFENLPFKSISEALRITESAAKMRLKESKNTAIIPLLKKILQQIKCY